jgi:hypothetical protein
MPQLIEYFDGPLVKTYTLNGKIKDISTISPVKRQKRIWNDPVRRPKPNDLLENMTSMTLQSSESWVYEKVVQTRDRDPARWMEGTRSGTFVKPMPDVAWQTDFRNAVSDAVASQVGESVYEARETAKSVYDGAKWLWDTYRCIKSLGFKCTRFKRRRKPTARQRSEDARKSFGDLTDADLGIKLGLKPTVDLIHELHDRYNSRSGSQLVKVTSQSSGTKSTNGEIWRIQCDKSCRAVGYVKISHNARIWTVNPILVAWEVIPVSFMVDWFWDVGSTLKSWYMPSGFEFVGGCVSEKTRIRAIGKTYPTPVKYYQDYWYRTLSPGVYTYTSHKRDAFSTLPPMRYLPPAPDLGNPSYSKLWTALEILGKLKRLF